MAGCLRFSTNITADGLTVTKGGAGHGANDLVLTTASNDTIAVTGWFAIANAFAWEFQFADGTLLSAQDLLSLKGIDLSEATGDNSAIGVGSTITGTSANDILLGGGGLDTLYGTFDLNVVANDNSPLQMARAG